MIGVTTMGHSGCQRCIRNLLRLSFAVCLAAQPVWAAVDKHAVSLQRAGEYVHQHDYHHAYLRFHGMARQGCPRSQCIVGMMHQRGCGTKKDAAMAAYWFEKSAKQNFADAQARLGAMYLHGDGITADTKQGVFWLEKAASQGWGQAQYDLGKFYVQNGGQSLMTKGRSLLEAAEKQGIADARVVLNQLPAVSAPPGAAPTTPLSSGLHNVEDSWAGYAAVVNELSSVNAAAKH